MCIDAELIICNGAFYNKSIEITLPSLNSIYLTKPVFFTLPCIPLCFFIRTMFNSRFANCKYDNIGIRKSFCLLIFDFINYYPPKVDLIPQFGIYMDN